MGPEIPPDWDSDSRDPSGILWDVVTVGESPLEWKGVWLLSVWPQD